MFSTRIVAPFSASASACEMMPNSASTAPPLCSATVASIFFCENPVVASASAHSSSVVNPVAAASFSISAWLLAQIGAMSSPVPATWRVASFMRKNDSRSMLDRSEVWSNARLPSSSRIAACPVASAILVVASETLSIVS